MHWAVVRGRAEVVALLLRHHADVSPRDEQKITPLHYAPTVAVAELLLAAGADIASVDRFGRTALHASAYSGNTPVLPFFLQNGLRIDTLTNDGQTPLHLAANADIVELLVKSGAEIEAANCDGRTPLHGAAHLGRGAVVGALICAGANVQATAKNRHTPLHEARNAACAHLLLFAGADPRATDAKGLTPLQWAAYYGRADVVAALIDAETRRSETTQS